MTAEEFSSLRVGDKVRIIDTPISKEMYGIPEMEKWRGKVMTVRKSTDKKRFMYCVKMEEDISEGFHGWNWYKSMIAEKVEDDGEEGHIRSYTELERYCNSLKRENSKLKKSIDDMGGEVIRLKARLFDVLDKYDIAEV